MEQGRWGCGDELAAALDATTCTLADLPVTVSRLSGADLVAVLQRVDRLAALAAAARFTELVKFSV